MPFRNGYPDLALHENSVREPTRYADSLTVVCAPRQQNSVGKAKKCEGEGGWKPWLSFILRHPTRAAGFTHGSYRHPQRSDRHPHRSEWHPRHSERHPHRSDRHPRHSERHPRRSDRHSRCSMRHPEHIYAFRCVLCVLCGECLSAVSSSVWRVYDVWSGVHAQTIQQNHFLTCSPSRRMPSQHCAPLGRKVR